MPEVDKTPHYVNSSDVQQRLQGTIVKYKGQPYYCGACAGMILALYDLPYSPEKTFTHTVDANDKNLETRNIPVGYINIGQSCQYIIRNPARQTKSAIAANLLGFFYKETFVPISTATFLSQSFKSALMNEYPMAHIALKDLKETPGRWSIAFNRDFAFGKSDNSDGIHLLFQEQIIGRVMESGFETSVNLDEEYKSSFFTMSLMTMNVNAY